MGQVKQERIAYDPNSVIEMKLYTDKRVQIQAGGSTTPIFNDTFPVGRPAARLAGRWVIECAGHKVAARELDSRNGKRHIIFMFQEGINVDIAYRYAQMDYKKSWKGVGRIDVYPKGISEFTITSSLEESRAGRMEGEAANSQFRQMQAELEEERKRGRQLQEALEQRIDTFISDMAKNKDALEGSVQKKIEELEEQQVKNEILQAQVNKLVSEQEELEAQLDRLENKKEGLQMQIDSLVSERDVLYGQLDRLACEKELLELDCGEASKRLDGMRTQVCMDKDAYGLLISGNGLKKGSVEKTLDGMEEEIADVEEHISRIIKYRMEYAKAVEEAILHGDGTIRECDEAGGQSDGD